MCLIQFISKILYVCQEDTQVWFFSIWLFNLFTKNIQWIKMEPSFKEKTDTGFNVLEKREKVAYKPT